GLSTGQKETLTRLWFALKSRLDTTQGQLAIGEERIAQESRAFLAQVEESSDLGELAQVPLLLVLLLFLRFQDAILPRDRFNAYKEVIDYLIKLHPTLRRVASLTAAPVAQLLREREVFAILGRVAYEMQTSYPDGLIPHAMLID